MAGGRMRTKGPEHQATRKWGLEGMAQATPGRCGEERGADGEVVNGHQVTGPTLRSAWKKD